MLPPRSHNATRYHPGSDDNQAPVAYVILAGGLPLRLGAYTPGRVWRWLLTWCIRILSCSSISHCAVGDGACVLESTFERIAYRPFDAYLYRMPGLVGFFKVPLKGPLDLEAPGLPPKSGWRVALQYATAGRCPHHSSCVTLTADRLRRAGVAVPRLATPGGLARWLRSKGYHYESLE